MVVTVVKIAYAIVLMACVLYIVNCANPPREVYLGEDDGACRYTSSGDDAPEELCAKKESR